MKLLRNESCLKRLEAGDSAQWLKHILLLHRTRVQLPAFTWWPTTTHDSSSRGSNASPKVRKISVCDSYMQGLSPVPSFFFCVNLVKLLSLQTHRALDQCRDIGWFKFFFCLPRVLLLFTF